MKITNSRGDLIDISAEKETLQASRKYYLFSSSNDLLKAPTFSKNIKFNFEKSFTGLNAPDFGNRAGFTFYVLSDPVKTSGSGSVDAC